MLHSLVLEHKDRPQTEVRLYIEQPKESISQQGSQPKSQEQSNNLLAENYDEMFPSLDQTEKQDSERTEIQDMKPEIAQNYPYINVGQIDSSGPSNQQESGSQAIPLPFYGPLNSQYNQKQKNKNDYDIPMAPPSNAPPLEAPNQYNTISHFNSIKDFKGTVTAIPLNYDLG